MAMVAPLLPSFVRHCLCSRADLTALDLGSSLFFSCFCCHFVCPQGWHFERSSHKVERSKGKVPQGWDNVVFQKTP